MVTFDCPWCTEPADLRGPALEELACDTCGIVIEIAPDPVGERLAPAA